MKSLISFLGFSCILYSVQGQEVCSRTCESSYPLHTVDKVAELQACTKGCRLQLISHLSGREEPCDNDCNAAYDSSSANVKKACIMGCNEQKLSNTKQQVLEIEETSGVTFQFHFFYPIASARNYYHSWFNGKNSGTVESSSSYFIEQSTSSDGNGNSIFMRVEMYPGISPQQAQFNQFTQGDTEVNQEQPSMIKHYVHKMHGKASKWLNCVETRAGVPYATLVAVLFLSLAMVAWICCSTCDEADEEKMEKKHTFSKTGLSIMADELRIRDHGDVKLFTISASGSEEAGPLPVKEKLLQV